MKTLKLHKNVNLFYYDIIPLLYMTWNALLQLMTFESIFWPFFFASLLKTFVMAFVEIFGFHFFVSFIYSILTQA